MSLATTCPNCSTCFRVVQDQLRVSEGWVRCGHCQQVFNALESLFDLDAPQEPIAPPTPSATPAPGRGTWQTEATARWMRRRERASSSAPGSAPAPEPPAAMPAATSWPTGEREEPLSADLLATLQAGPAPVSSLDEPSYGGRDGERDDESDSEGDTDLDVDSDGAPANGLDVAEGVPSADHAAVWSDGFTTPQPVPVAQEADLFSGAGDVEPAPADDTTGSETTFAPFPATETRQEPVFEATRYEAHGFEEPAAAAAPPDAVDTQDDTSAAPPAVGDTAPPAPAPDAGPPSAAMFLAEAEPQDDTGAAQAEALPLPLAPVLFEPPSVSAAPAQDREVPSFLTAAARRERGVGPLARWAFGGAAVLLVAALAMQVAWHWRDRLAMAWPITATPLSMLCRLAGCELGPPRELDALAVDNTALARPPGSAGYRLTIQLHNLATHPVAAPSFDLVLTDAQGATVARRTLLPADFDVRDAALAANAEVQWSTEFTLTEGGLVGYTVAAFYP